MFIYFVISWILYNNISSERTNKKECNIHDRFFPDNEEGETLRR